MLSEQQFAILRSEPGANRVAKAMSLAGVTQTALAKALGMAALLRQRRRPAAVPDNHPSRAQGSSRDTSAAASRTYHAKLAPPDVIR